MRDDIKTALEKNKEFNKFFSTFGFKGMLKGLEKHLKSDEKVKYVRNTNVQMNRTDELKPNAMSIKGKQPSILAVTDQRVLVYQKIFPNEKLEQFPIKEIRSYDFTKGLTSSKLRIASLTKNVDIDLTLSGKEVKHLNDILSELTSKPQVVPKDNSTDTTKHLRDLLDLKNDGVITEDEFEKKKAELLARL